MGFRVVESDKTRKAGELQDHYLGSLIFDLGQIKNPSTHLKGLRSGGRIKLMEPESGSRSGFSLTRFGLRGSAGLVVAVSVVAILLIALPVYRWFFLISFLIGLVIAGGLALWHKLHPIKEQDVHPKRPLGL